jgi:hypothetical protein
MTNLIKISAILSLFLSGCSAEKANKPFIVGSSTQLSEAHYRSAIVFEDAPNGTHARFSTEKAVPETLTPPEEYRSDFLIAAVDKKYGNTGFVLTHLDATKSWRSASTVSFETPQGTFSKTAPVKGKKNECNGSDCWHLESVSVVIPESLMRAYALKYPKEQSGSWKFKISPNTDGQIPYAEIAGLLARVDEYRKSLGISKQ